MTRPDYAALAAAYIAREARANAPRRARLAAALDLTRARLAAAPSDGLRARVDDLFLALLDGHAKCRHCLGDGGSEYFVGESSGWDECELCCGSGRARTMRLTCTSCEGHLDQEDADAIGEWLVCPDCHDHGYTPEEE